MSDDHKFLEYYHNLSSVIVIKILDGEYGWACRFLEDYRKEGLLKVLVSRMATIKILPGNNTLPRDNNKYIRSLKNQMMLNSLTSLYMIEGFQSMHASVTVEEWKESNVHRR